MRNATVLAGVLLALGAAVEPARAQTAATSLVELQSSVKAGDTVTVTTSDGREIRGRILSLSASALEIAQPGAPSIFGETDISTVSRRDSSLNGMLWGLAAAAALGVLAEKSLADYYDEASVDGSIAIPMGVAGAGIGFAVDWLIKGRRVIYRARPGGGTATVHGRGVRVSLRW